MVTQRGWESNRRSGVALAMCHGLSDLSTYKLNDLSACGVWHLLPKVILLTFLSLSL